MLSTFAGGTRQDVAVGEALLQHLGDGSLRGVAWRLVLVVVAGLLGFGLRGLAGEHDSMIAALQEGL